MNVEMKCSLICSACLAGVHTRAQDAASACKTWEKMNEENILTFIAIDRCHDPGLKLCFKLSINLETCGNFTVCGQFPCHCSSVDKDTFSGTSLLCLVA